MSDQFPKSARDIPIGTLPRGFRSGMMRDRPTKNFSAQRRRGSRSREPAESSRALEQTRPADLVPMPPQRTRCKRSRFKLNIHSANSGNEIAAAARADVHVARGT
jgi:hypothetical protein